jgi:hypothetical protein
MPKRESMPDESGYAEVQGQVEELQVLSAKAHRSLLTQDIPIHELSLDFPLFFVFVVSPILFLRTTRKRTPYYTTHRV